MNYLSSRCSNGALPIDCAIAFMAHTVIVGALHPPEVLHSGQSHCMRLYAIVTRTRLDFEDRLNLNLESTLESGAQWSSRSYWAYGLASTTYWKMSKVWAFFELKTRQFSVCKRTCGTCTPTCSEGGGENQVFQFAGRSMCQACAFLPA